jgi:hypothetical protein
MRKSYWSCSEFADWLRGTKKLPYGTSDEWDDWDSLAKANNQIRFWLAETALDKLQDIIMWPIDTIYNIKYYCVNRWVTKTHQLTAAPQDIKPGEWCDVGNRFLPCLFNELVNFVEVEQAWHHIAWDEDASKKYEAPFNASGYFNTRTWRCPEAGLEYLDWASELRYDANIMASDHPKFGHLTDQALAAREIRELYYWWKVQRPQRVDPYDASGFNELIDQDAKFFTSLKNMDKDKSKKANEMIRDLEELYENEDEEMMIRLIKIRQGLWT